MLAQSLQEPAEVEASLRKSVGAESTLSFLVDLACQTGEHLYVVGGFLRDALLGRPLDELDLVAPRAGEWASACARECGAHRIKIDRKFGTIRLIPPEGEAGTGIRRIDLSPLRGASILDDLRYRDFTVNAMAVDLPVWRNTGRLEFIDPLGGLDDLRSGQLRVCTPRSFTADPLRILRAYRFLATYELTLDFSTRSWIRESGRHLAEVAVERVRDELCLILECPRAAPTFKMLEQDGLVGVIFPECEPMRGLQQSDHHHLDVWAHSLATLEAVEDLLAQPYTLLPDSVDEVRAVMEERLAGERTRCTIVKLGALLHDVGKPAAWTADKQGVRHFFGHEVVGARLAAAVCARLRFSNREIHELSDLVRQHMRVLHLLRLDPPSHRALSRFFRLGPNLFWPLLLLSAADYRATVGPPSAGGEMTALAWKVGRWLSFYHRQIKPMAAIPLLINGHDLMTHLDLSPGPLVGRLLKAVSELQWDGRVSSRRDALDAASRLLEGWRGHPE
ncbi:MAG TPA: HD domain-containing protein [Syntrophobacteria bacterium]|nr:HD domain-containing protein [Syntrophobacteria bacterium]